MKIIKDIKSSDYIEFAYAYTHNFEQNKDTIIKNHLYTFRNLGSIFLSSDEFLQFGDWFALEMPDLDFFGFNIVNKERWQNISKSINTKNNELIDFFNEVNIWLQADPYKSNFFYVLGV